MTRLFNFSARAGLLLAIVSLTACGVYNPPLAQGNVFKADQIAALKVGMSKQGVLDVMGTPLLQDAFTKNRWDYVYRLASRTTLAEQSTVTLTFDAANRLIDWTGRPAQASNNLASATAASMLNNTARLSSDVSASNSSAAIIQVASAPSVVMPTVVAVPVALPAVVSTPAVATAAAAAPSKPTVSDFTSSNPQVTQSIESWRKAWSGRDLRNYLAAYAATYKGELASRDAWVTGRTRIISNAGNISLTFGTPTLTWESADRVSAEFSQNYRSDVFKQTGKKTLQMQRIDGEFKIINEMFSE